METLSYIFKSATILSLFYIVYYIVLRKDTFFSSNRHFLIGGIIASVLLPSLVFTNTVYVDAPVLSVGLTPNSVTISETMAASNSFILDWWEIGVFIYLAGVLFMVFRFIKQLASLYSLLRKETLTKSNGFSYITVNSTITPFSFFRYIVYNPALHSEEDLQMILKHEETHATQLHSIDVMLSNLLLILQWMNPFAWLYKKSIEENLEFIADSETVVKVQSKKEYQLSMLKEVSSNYLQPVLANNFYQSLIKKRIIMLQKNQSSSKKQWKLLLILPLLGFFLWSFNVKEEIIYKDYSSLEPTTEASTKIHSNKEEINIPVLSEKKSSLKPIALTKKNFIPASEKESKSIGNKITVTVDKNTSDAELEKLKKLFKTSYNVTLKFNGVKRNSSDLIIKIKVTMKSENSNASFNLDDTDGIQEFIISYDDANGSISIGNANTNDIHFSPKVSSGYVYKIDEDSRGNVKTWVSRDASNVKKGKKEYILHKIDEDENGGEEIHIISGSGKNSNVWISRDGDKKNSVLTITTESDEEHDGNGTIFLYHSDDDDDDTMFIPKADDKGFFFIGNDGKDPLVFINGEKSTKEGMEKLNSDSIVNIEIIKGDKAIEKYGKDAKDGVILIKTKKK